MYRNYFKSNWRALIRNKGISLINLSGLSIGLAVAILISLLLLHDFSYDQFHQKKDRIFQIYTRSLINGSMQYDERTPMPLSPLLKTNFPEVEEITRTNWETGFVLTVGDNQLQKVGLFADTGFLRIFSFPLTKGNPQTALSSRRCIVITERLAKALFGHAEAMSKLIKVDSNVFQVTGVMKDQPDNTQFNFDYILPWTYMKEVGWENTNWKDVTVGTYVLLKPGTDEKRANARFKNILHAQLSENTTELFLHPLSKLWLYSEFKDGENTGRIENDRHIGIIGGLILLIACINYINLNTAQSLKRAKEVGIRKVSGARKRELILQFLGESIIITLIAGVISLIIAQISLHWFNALMFEQLSIPYNNPYFWLGAAGLIFITGVIAGFYPAFYLSSYKPVQVLKGTFKPAHTLVTPRKVLVILQFTSAITFIVSTIIIFSQINFASKRNSGYNPDHLVWVYINGDINKRYKLIKNELLKSNVAITVTRSSSPISYIWTSDDSYSWPGKDPNAKITIDEFHTDNDFVKTIGLQLTKGRDININSYPTDSTAVLLNESAEKLMRFKNPLGQTLKSNSGNWHIIGVVKNFIAGSPFNEIPPMVIQGPKNYWFGAVTIRLNAKLSTSANLKKVEEIFHKFNPEYPFAFHFVDDANSEKFQEQQHTGTQAAIFGGLSILISCLGLFSLATFVSENRTKEIGIRKVLGASSPSISVLLVKEFLKLIAISFLIASSISWWAMNNWLQSFFYRIDISFWVFAFSGLLTVMIALSSVGYQSIKASLTNPIKSLRTE
jgi:putative ABC transport system permease protein